MNREMNIVDEAKMIIAVQNHRPLTDVIKIPLEAKIVYLIKYYHKQQKLSQIQLVELSGMSQSQIAKIENMKQGLNVTDVDIIFRVLGIKIEIVNQ